MINCIYHPVYPMRVVDDEEYEKLLSTGEWFKHPTEAKNVRKDYERQLLRDSNKRILKPRKSIETGTSGT